MSKTVERGGLEWADPPTHFEAERARIPEAPANSRKKVLAISSGGGHWIQLLRIAPAFVDHEMIYVTVDPASHQQVGGARFYVVNDATRWNKLGLLKAAARLAWIILTEQPHVIVSTGAAPGYLAIRIGRWLGIRSVWVDSIANAETLSLSGERVGRHADLWLTQWRHLQRPQGPWYAGAVV